LGVAAQHLRNCLREDAVYSLLCYQKPTEALQLKVFHLLNWLRGDAVYSLLCYQKPTEAL
jgi:hypothetical protein